MVWNKHCLVDLTVNKARPACYEARSQSSLMHFFMKKAGLCLIILSWSGALEASGLSWCVLELRFFLKGRFFGMFSYKKRKRKTKKISFLFCLQLMVCRNERTENPSSDRTAGGGKVLTRVSFPFSAGLLESSVLMLLGFRSTWVPSEKNAGRLNEQDGSSGRAAADGSRSL